MPKQCQNLSPNERERLINLLRQSEYVFNGTLGTRKTAPVDLELKDEATPVCLCPYPVPRVHEKIFRKEYESLVKLDVLEEANYSEWGTPHFSQPKTKTNRVILLSSFWNLNRQLKYKPYPTTKSI